MPQTKILVDSCSYFRLAQNIHPLLSVAFGAADYTLYAHAELKAEFSRTPRLQTKFEWFMEADYIENRARPLSIGRKEKGAIKTTFEFMWPEVKSRGPSRVDTWILATAYELRLTMVTDDADLRYVAKDYGVKLLTSMELMRLMLKHGHIDMDKVRQVAAQWIYERETPNANFAKDFRRLFSEAPSAG